MPPSAPPPPRSLPLVYFAAGYLALAWALVEVALRPESIAGFFFHPRMFFVVHLVTLGWTTTAILGALYLVGPLALRTHLPAGKLDWTVCGATLLGISGVVSHFYIDEYSGVAYSGAVLVVAFLVGGWRVLGALRRSRSPGAVRLHIVLAYGNLILTATLGTLLAINKVGTILPGNRLSDAFGHAHLGAAGFVTLMVMGVGYRLIPMFLPAGPPRGPLVWASALLTEAGVLGLPLSFLFAPALAKWFAVLIALGLVAFLVNVVRMLRDPRPPPVKLPRPDVGMLHTLQALFYLAGCTALGLYLAFAEGWQLGAIMVYGTALLLGFMAQIVLGIGMRLLPMFAWIRAWVGSGYEELPPSQYAMPSRPLQWISFLAWTAGVPLVAWGLADDHQRLLAAGAWVLLAGLVAAGTNAVRVVRHAFTLKA
jgi:hypothetical protein